ncbi:MAG: response regulator [Patescibacteria group bacterium]|nr:response regulator [Patescibacteria group bacterium]MDE2116309.1 response regulator [Patescibacteria group bacterium]
MTNLQGKKVVWVEDDKYLVSLISERMAETGAKLVVVSDSLKAHDTVKTEMPDIVVLDLLMKYLDGFEVLKQLKADPSTKAIPVFVLSNLGQEQEIERAKELGAAKFVVKASIGLDGIIPEIGKVIAK